MREQIAHALQMSLDPLSAQLAMDAVHPVLDNSSGSKSFGVRRRRILPSHEETPFTLKPIPSSSSSQTRRSQFSGYISQSEAMRSRSEPSALEVKSKRLNNKIGLQGGTLPPLSLPSLVSREKDFLQNSVSESSEKYGYDTLSMLGILRLTRDQRSPRRKQLLPLQLQDTEETKIAKSTSRRRSSIDKVNRVEAMRQLYQRNQSAMTDTLEDEPSKAAEDITDERVADNNEVKRIESRDSQSVLSTPIGVDSFDFQDRTKTTIQPLKGHEVGEKDDEVDDDPLDNSALLKWSLALDPSSI